MGVPLLSAERITRLVPKKYSIAMRYYRVLYEFSTSGTSFSASMSCTTGWRSCSALHGLATTLMRLWSPCTMRSLGCGCRVSSRCQ